MLKVLRAIVKSPFTNLIAGIILLITCIMETIQEISESGFEVGAHHGLLIFSLLHILKAIPDIFEGLEYVEHGTEK